MLLTSRSQFAFERHIQIAFDLDRSQFTFERHIQIAFDLDRSQFTFERHIQIAFDLDRSHADRTKGAFTLANLDLSLDWTGIRFTGCVHIRLV